MTTVAAASTTPSPLWYATRATGAVALILLTVIAVLGIVGVQRITRPNWPGFVTAGLHRNISLMAVAFVGLHIATSVLDPYAKIGWLAAIVPFSSSYRPIWLGLGAVAFDLLLALIITSLLRTRMNRRLWRISHWAAYACWPVAVLHELGTGTDAAKPLIITIMAVCVAAVLISVIWRLATADPGHRVARLGGGVAAAAALAAIAALLFQGPLQPGWAARAGTPARSTAQESTTAPRLPAAPFSTHLTGTVSQRAGGAAVISKTFALTGSDQVALRLVMSGPPAGNGGVVLSASSVEFGTAAVPNLYTGQITTLSGNIVGAHVSNATGKGLSLAISLTQDASNVTGSLSVSLG